MKALLQIEPQNSREVELLKLFGNLFNPVWEKALTDDETRYVHFDVVGAPEVVSDCLLKLVNVRKLLA